MNQLPIVAIIGRPNVGKSTLFNRLVGTRRAIEADQPGTTRDRLYDQAEWVGKSFNLVDTAGLFDLKKANEDELQNIIKENVLEAVDEADLILFIVDYNVEDNLLDKTIAAMLRRGKKKVLLVVNKADNSSRLENLQMFKRFGSWPVIGVSATLKRNLGELLDLIVKELQTDFVLEPKSLNQDKNIKIAFIGRPNVGKSTLLNAFLDKNKAIVSAVPGTTRDSLEEEFRYKGRNLILLDTAGILRAGKSGRGIEKFSLIRTLKAISEADLVIVLMEANEGVTFLDKKIAGFVAEGGKSLILAFNKIDVLENLDQKKEELITQARQDFNFLPFAPLVFISAKSKENIKVVLNQALKVVENRDRRIGQEELDQLLEIIKKGFGQLPEIKNLMQTGSRPPEFTIVLRNKKARWHFSFTRFIENRLRDNFDFTGTPIKVKIQ